MNTDDKKGYVCKRAGFGYYTFAVESYRDFIYHIAPLFVKARPVAAHERRTLAHEFVWRGHTDPKWILQSSLSRFASREVRTEDSHEWQREVSRMTTNHLITFLLHLRGTGVLNREH